MAHPGSPRIDWWELPASVRGEVEGALGGAVVAATTCEGGFSPGAACIVETATGQRSFVKSAGVPLNPDSPRLHRREIEVMSALPPGLPAPTLRATIDDGEWVTLVYDVIDGRLPHLSWHRAELDRVLDALCELASVEATALAPFTERHAPLFGGWRALASEGPLDSIDSWSRRHLDALVELEPAWEVAAEGSALVHSDVRADNVLLTDTRVVFVDWAHACHGAPWLDLLITLPSVEVGGGPRPDEIWASHPLARVADAGAVDTVLVALAGYFTHRATMPPVQGLPTIRQFQADQGAVARRWLAERRSWT